MTPLDSLERQIRERMSYHTECLSRPWEDPMFHVGILHGLISALGMVQRMQRSQG